MARLQFHDQLRVQDLTEGQLNALSALLSAPEAAPRPSTPLRPFLFPSSSSASASSSVPSTSALASIAEADEIIMIERNPPPAALDPITTLIIEEDLRRQTRANIAHHRTIGTLTGRQHAMGLPVRGQNNRTNGKTAKRLNRIERRGYCTSSSVSVIQSSVRYHLLVISLSLPGRTH